tara:strand:+ start:990 stop:1655 length:666 start_codon:yes stop_codon:yes gene_type:complete
MNTKGIFFIILLFFIITSSSVTAERKNPPNDNQIEIALKEAGDQHFPEKFKFDEIGSVEYEETYYHAYIGYNKDGTYRLIFFNNSLKYLGYYSVEFEPIDYEKGAVLLDDGADGNYYVRIGKDGPLENILVDGMKITFNKNKKNEEKEKKVIADVIEKPKIEYRIWTIKRGGKIHNPECIFVRKIGSKIFLKEKTRGKTAEFTERELSEADLKYLESLDEL